MAVYTLYLGYTLCESSGLWKRILIGIRSGYLGGGGVAQKFLLWNFGVLAFMFYKTPVFGIL